MTRDFLTRAVDFLQHHTKAVLIWVALVFWIAALSYAVYLGDRLPYPDEQWYFNDYAQNIARLHMFSWDGVNPTAFHPPVYPLLLGGLVWVGFGVTTARLMNFLAMFLTLISLFYLLENQLRRLAPVVAVLLGLAYPVLFYTAGTLYPQTLGALFFILSILFYWKEPLQVKDALLAGFALGLACLTVPTFLFVPFFMLAFSLIFRRQALAKTTLLFLMVFVTISPWTIRNYVTFDQFKLVSTNFGLNFLIGNSPTSTAMSGTSVSDDLKPVYEEANGLDDFEQDAFYTKKAISYIVQNPQRYTILYIQKLVNYFNFRNDLSTASESNRAKDLLMLFTYWGLLSVAVLRLFLVRKYPLSKMELFLVLLYTSNAFVSAVTFPRIRFRLPFDYLLIATVALFIESAIFNLLRRQK